MLSLKPLGEVRKSAYRRQCLSCEMTPCVAFCEALRLERGAGRGGKQWVGGPYAGSWGLRDSQDGQCAQPEPAPSGIQLSASDPSAGRRWLLSFVLPEEFLLQQQEMSNLDFPSSWLLFLLIFILHLALAYFLLYLYIYTHIFCLFLKKKTTHILVIFYFRQLPLHLLPWTAKQII